MFCTGKEQLTCNSEKLGCEGCYFNDEKNKDEVKIGDYVRTIDGYIRKVIQVNKKGSYEGLCYGAYSVDIKYKNSVGISAKKIKSFSKNIIELIEKGDIVHTKDVLNEDYYYMFDDEMIEATKETIKEGITLVDILTHEQYKENCYRVKE